MNTGTANCDQKLHSSPCTGTKHTFTNEDEQYLCKTYHKRCYLDIIKTPLEDNDKFVAEVESLVKENVGSPLKSAPLNTTNSVISFPPEKITHIQQRAKRKMRKQLQRQQKKLHKLS